MNVYLAATLVALGASGCLLVGAAILITLWNQGSILVRIVGVWFALAFLALAVGIVLQGLGAFS